MDDLDNVGNDLVLALIRAGGPATEMTLLDWFSGQALTRVVTNLDADASCSNVAALSYEYAAAMLAEKKRREALP